MLAQHLKSWGSSNGPCRFKSGPGHHSLQIPTPESIETQRWLGVAGFCLEFVPCGFLWIHPILTFAAFHGNPLGSSQR